MSPLAASQSLPISPRQDCKRAVNKIAQFASKSRSIIGTLRKTILPPLTMFRLSLWILILSIWRGAATATHSTARQSLLRPAEIRSSVVKQPDNPLLTVRTTPSNELEVNDITGSTDPKMQKIWQMEQGFLVKPDTASNVIQGSTTGSQRNLQDSSNATNLDFDEDFTNSSALASPFTNSSKKKYHFAVVVHVATGSVGSMQGRGCVEGAEQWDKVSKAGQEYELTCEIMGAQSNAELEGLAETQLEIVKEIIRAPQGVYHGIAIDVLNPDEMGPLLDRAVHQGLAVVSIAADAYPASKLRHAFIGTNNTFLGEQLAKVLNQLNPEGGNFGTISVPLGDPFFERRDGFQRELLENSDGVWTQVENSPSESTSIVEALEHAEGFAQQNATAIAILLNVPFVPPEYQQMVDRHRKRGLNITFVGIGDTPHNLDLLARRYVHGIVGQVPYEMGYYAVDLMMQVLMDEDPIEQTVIETNVLTHIMVPVVLPELLVDHNRVGNLAIIGYIFFTLTALTGLAFGFWVWYYRGTRVVKASQPTFLLMVAAGIIIMSSGIIPLGFDDSHGIGEGHAIAICMSSPWLICTGFTVSFSALFSKTSRVNRIFKAGSGITRIKISTRDVILQCCVLLLLNIVVLLCWTIFDPLTYTRSDNPGTDGWNRVISTSGTCQSEHVARYWVPLAAINLLSLCVANWQAYQARSLSSEFSESKYIGIACVSMMQTALMGIPILIVVQDQPEALYLVLVCMIFVVSMAVLLLIFVPKMVLMESYNRFSTRTQGRMIQNVIREAAKSGACESSMPSKFSRGCNSHGFESDLKRLDLDKPNNDSSADHSVHSHVSWISAGSRKPAGKK